jgi:hypothetical protein
MSQSWEKDIKDQDNTNYGACIETAAKHGFTSEQAEACNDGSVGCADCPFKQSKTDQTETTRMMMQHMINSNPQDRVALEATCGKDNVWDTQELQRDFIVKGFMAPLCVVTRKSDNKTGTVYFQHHPRFYFSFISEEELDHE